MTETIIWHQLATESEAERIDRLNETLHRIFFDGRECYDESDESAMCTFCDEYSIPKHGTPRFLESLDAMQLIVESGRFAEVREEYFDWLEVGKKKHECTIFLYTNTKTTDRIYFRERDHSRQEAFLVTALKAMGYTVIKEGQGEQ